MARKEPGRMFSSTRSTMKAALVTAAAAFFGRRERGRVAAGASGLFGVLCYF